MLVSLIGCTAETQAEVIDLTEYDEKLTYIEVEKITKDPMSYSGKTLKFNGVYMVAKNQETGETMNLCVVNDETACCMTYIEFQLPEGTEYPKENEKITLSGNLQAISKGNTTYPVILFATVS